MGTVLDLVNGIPRLRTETTSSSTEPVIYDETVKLVNTSPAAGEILGPITSGTAVTLPNSGTYEGEELEVYVNNIRLDDVIDYNYVGAGPTRTQVTFTFDLVVGDVVRFRVDRNP